MGAKLERACRQAGTNLEAAGAWRQAGASLEAAGASLETAGAAWKQLERAWRQLRARQERAFRQPVIKYALEIAFMFEEVGASVSHTKY